MSSSSGREDISTSSSSNVCLDLQHEKLHQIFFKIFFILIYRKTFSAKNVFELLESILQILGSWPIVLEKLFNELGRRWDALWIT
jgi:hypothetical protein